MSQPYIKSAAAISDDMNDEQIARIYSFCQAAQRYFQKCNCRLEILMFCACECLCSAYPFFESGEVTA